MRDIFISYVQEEKHIAEELAMGLEEAGYSAWYYTRDGKTPGISYVNKEREVIEQCQAVILIISRHSVESRQVEVEVFHAHKVEKQFIPLLLDITYDEFVQAKPGWDFVLGTVVSNPIPPEGVRAILPAIRKSLNEMSISPRPHLVTGDLPPASPAEAMVEPPYLSPRRRALRGVEIVRKNLYPVVAAIALVAAVSAAIFLWVRQNRSDQGDATDREVAPGFIKGRPLTTTDFRDQFDDLRHWTNTQGWAVGGGWAEVGGAQTIGYLTGNRYGSFRMVFQLKLINGRGAAWALRVSDKGYYLFYLTGAQGKPENRFVTYIARPGKIEQVGTPRNLPTPLQAGGIYTITISVEQNLFKHSYRIDDTPDDVGEGDEHPLDEYTDASNVFPAGSIGFRALDYDKFAVADLMIFPPLSDPKP